MRPRGVRNGMHSMRVRVAIAGLVSLVLHALFAPLVSRIPQARADDTRPPLVSIDHVKPRPPVTRSQTPPPRPAHTPVAVRSVAVRSVAAVARPRVRRPVRPPRLSERVARTPGIPNVALDRTTSAGDGAQTSGDGSNGVVPGEGEGTSSGLAATALPAPTLTPAPVALTPKPSCAHPQSAAHTIDTAEPDTPESARERGATGTATVRVDLAETGTVRGVAIAHSAGDPSLDAAALDAARRSTYAPEIEDCSARPGSYLFRVEFDAG
jgi:protein TonB